jgi:hypothetical protein
MSFNLTFKGQSSSVSAQPDDSTDVLFAAAAAVFSLEPTGLKLIFKGKQIAPGVSLKETALITKGTAPLKLMVMATNAAAAAQVQNAKSDATIKGFAAEDDEAAARRGEAADGELSVWTTPQHAEHRFCRFEFCTWQSFGARPNESTPHAFEARKLLHKLATDPAIVRIMVAREWRVGVLAEMDPIDDRLAEKLEGEGKRLLGLNTNGGARIDIRLRTMDLAGFLNYPALVDTLLHELTHNEVSEHNELFYQIFCQLKVDYLRALKELSSQGRLIGGRSPLQLADATEEARDVRAATVAALERDRQRPASDLQLGLLDAYLTATADATAEATVGRVLGGGGVSGRPADQAELAARRIARLGGGTSSSSAAGETGSGGGGAKREAEGAPRDD